ncbi:alpha/beta fold hydrolase [Lysobacter soli]|uniref:Alpha/beta fold hydrolase n=1 Tax=Lysobacter soli TaxID=453783 RepID=A0A3D8VE42_9GAMM|nr:alpha/beta fold hydrolase [Lysobacter soli]RDY67128.1 alpha/beta fold hydrolase [Lysobacter soli]
MATNAIRRAVLVHGAGGGGWEWNVWRRVFAALGIEAQALDLQPAEDGLEATGLADYAAQVSTALEASPRPCAVVGASLGGLLAMVCADAADALVLVNPLPPAPWVEDLPSREWPDVVPWQRDARLDSTRRALPDSDEATALFAFRRWRDESGLVLRQAHAGLLLDAPACPTLCIASSQDEDVPPEVTAELARAWDADLLRVASPGHVAPLLGRGAAAVATQAAAWLTARLSAR